MAPDPGQERKYTVSCNLRKAIPDAKHLTQIQNAVLRVNQCTFWATELLNLYIRDRIENHDGAGIDCIFDANWLMKGLQEEKNHVK